MAHATADGAAALSRLLPRSDINVSVTGYRRLERLAELAGSPLPPGLLGRWAAFANDLEATGAYECEDEFGFGASELLAVHEIDAETGERLPVVRMGNTAKQARLENTVSALLRAPEPHRSVFAAALRRLPEPHPRERHDWRVFPGARDVYGMAVVCAACGLHATAPEIGTSLNCRAGVRAPVSARAAAWYMSHFGEVAHIAAGVVPTPYRGWSIALCGEETSWGLVQFDDRNILRTPWGQGHHGMLPSQLRARESHQSRLRAERADCPACIAALADLPPALTGTHDWRIAGDRAGCPACGMTYAAAGDAAFGCDGGVHAAWIRSVRGRPGHKPPEARIRHGRGWDCAALRRSPDLPVADAGQRITCMSCLRAGHAAPALPI